MDDKKTTLVANIIKDIVDIRIRKILVVGCGSGLEAALLARCFEACAIGIDIVDDFDPDAAGIVKLQQGDAMALQFENKMFDFVYSYHSLEHMQYPIRALHEMYRVLRVGGWCWIGTPNRLRVIGYLGSKDATFQQKLKWNFIDWRERFIGNFKNDLGAHAGFSSSELSNMLEAVFTETKNMTNIYFQSLYNKYQYFLRVLQFSGLSTIVYPSVYFMALR